MYRSYTEGRLSSQTVSHDPIVESRDSYMVFSPERLKSVLTAVVSMNFSVVRKRSVQATSSTSDALPEEVEAAGRGKTYSDIVCSARALDRLVQHKASGRVVFTHFISCDVAAICNTAPGIQEKWEIAAGSLFSLEVDQLDVK